MTEFSQFHLLRPEWLWLALPALLFVSMLWRRRSRGGDWAQVIAPQLLHYLLEGSGSVGARRRPLLPWLLLGWLLAALALSGPSWQRLPQPVLQKQDALVILLDLSYSMWAQDSTPSRIESARRKILDLLSLRREGQTALIAYAGDAHIVTPLTDDTQTIANLVPVLDPGMMPVPGASADAAVELGLQLLRAAAQREGRLLLITDELSADERARIDSLLGPLPHTLSVLAVGTATGAPIPLPEGGFLKTDDGTIVLPAVDQQALAAVASAHGGRYSELRVDDGDLQHLLSTPGAAALSETRELARLTDTWRDMAHWFALPLLPLLLYAFRRGVVALLPLLLALGLLPAPAAEASIWQDLWLRPDQQGARAMAAGQPERAQALFKDPRRRGTAAFAAGNPEAAAQAFAEDDSADGWYNRGNALATAGELEAAAAAYRESLQRAPGRPDAEDNLRAVEELLRQQEEQPPDEQQQDGEDTAQDEAGQGPQNDGGAEQDGDNSQSENQDNAGDAGNGGAREQAAGGEGGAQRDQGSSADPALDEGHEPPDTGEQAAGQQEQGQSPSDAQQEQGSGGPGSGGGAEQQQTEMAARAAEALAEDLEREQALQQWLRRVPDDPAGLLREKFRYESRRRERRGENNAQKKVW